jgi:hypothetical protein
MAIQQCAVGQLVRVTATFTVGSTPTNPGTVTATVKDPTGALTNPSATNGGTGIYTVDVTPAMKGRYVVRLVGTSPVVAAAEVQFNAYSEVV